MVSRYVAVPFICGADQLTGVYLTPCPMTATTHGRKGRPWRRLREQVLREEPVCRYCGVRASTTVDHVLPLSRFPHLAHVRSNLVGACAWCQGSKGARTPAEWRPVHGVTRLEW